MSTFAETAIVDYRLSYANQGKKYIHFPFLFAANTQKFAVSVFRLQKNQKLPFPLGPFSVCKIPDAPVWLRGFIRGEVRGFVHSSTRICYFALLLRLSFFNR
jgi:hypothetical protein